VEVVRELSLEDVRALLNSAQQQRLHWARTITMLIGFVVVLNAGLWSYFLIEYIKVDGALPSYILVPSAVSVITLGLWRIYTRYIDNHIASLYPELVYYEARLSVPPEMGISGYLIRNVPHIEAIIKRAVPPDKKREAIACLVKRNRVGSRGHDKIERTTLGFITITLIASILSLWRVWDSIKIMLASVELSLESVALLLTIFYSACFVGIFLGLALVLFAKLSNQRNPEEGLVKKILKELYSLG